MSGQTWGYLAGDTSRFAISLGFESNPHDPDIATPEMAASWGTFQIWVDGLNLCLHREQGETIESVHWYLLPLIQWFVSNWNPLLHEERLPAPDFSTASAVAHDPVVISAQLAGTAELDWWSWWSRHSLQAAREGGLFPDVQIRRWRDVVELSWDNRGLAGAPDDFAFLADRGEHRVAIESVAEPLWDALGQALNQLAIRLPGSSVIDELRRRHRAIVREPARQERFAWLSGFEGTSGKFMRLWETLSARLESATERLRESLLTGENDQRLFLPGTPHAPVLFGSAAPNVTNQDVLQISSVLINTYSPQALDRSRPLERLRAELPPPEGDRPWQQGYALASSLLEALDVDTSRAVDIRRIAEARLGVTIDHVSLSDVDVRAVSIAGGQHVPTIFLNDQYVDGTSEAVQRFSIAHELCHLLIDPDRARNLAVTSGPWAPRDIEQRANAFAIALLLPESGVDSAVMGLDSPVELEVVQGLASRYQVSLLAVVHHIHNLGFIDVLRRNRLEALVRTRST